MRLVVIESPYAGDVDSNVESARACMRDSLNRGEAPFASHLLYTQDGILNDDVSGERGIAAGLAWARHAHLTAIYADFGISEGMVAGIQDAKRVSRQVEMRFIGSTPGSRALIEAERAE